MRTITRRSRRSALVIALLGSLLALVGPGHTAQAAAPTIVGRACSPGEGVTIVVDAQELGPDTIRIGCAPGEQADGFEALTNAGFTFNEDGGPVAGTICQIGGLPTGGHPDCWYDGFWGYWKSDGSDWTWSQVGAAAGPLPVDSVEAWSWAGEIDTTTYMGPLPRIAYADVADHAQPIDCAAIPQLPAISILHRDEVLPVSLSDGRPVEVAVLDPSADPATAAYTTASTLSLVDESGPTRVLARRAGSDCPDSPVFDFTYDVRDAYAPTAGTTGAGSPSPAVDRQSDDIVGWATGWLDYQPGPNVSASFQNPDNAVGGSGSLVVLGDRGRITLTFEDPITDGPGFDLAVFENSFTVNGPGGLDFIELAYVEVSSNGTDFVRFDSGSRQPNPVGAFAGQRADLVGGLAGKDLAHKGTPFDLAALANKPEVRSGAVDLSQITHVRLVDVTGDGADHDSFGRPIYDPHPTTGSGGFDLTGIAVLNAYEAPAEPDCALDGTGGTDAALDWLACEIDRNGGYLPAYGGAPDHGLTLDAVLAFGIHDRGDDPAAQAALDTVYGQIRDYVSNASWGDGEDRYAGATAKSLLAGLLVDADTTDVDGLDLEDVLRGLLRADGEDAGRFSDQSAYGDYSNGFGQTLAILALSRTADGVPEPAITFLLAQQCPDGGFRGFYATTGGCVDSGESDTDYTAMAVAALRSALQTNEVVDAIDAGAAWLIDHQAADGSVSGSGLVAGANSNSTGVAAQALRAVGRSTEADAAVGWIRGLQLVDGLDPALAGHLGAIAYNQAGFDAAVADGIADAGLDQWRRATAQAVLADGAPSFGLPGAYPEDPEPEEPQPEEPQPEEPQPEEPGTNDPGAGDPGSGDPGTQDPGTGDPGTGDSGAPDPGPGAPGDGQSGGGITALPRTGASIAATVLIALLAIGGGVVLLERRRTLRH